MYSALRKNKRTNLTPFSPVQQKGGASNQSFIQTPLLRGITAHSNKENITIISSASDHAGKSSHTVQRIVPEWQVLHLPASFSVFHGTSPEHAQNIIQNGILNVPNGFGGGQLGAGFYTYTTAEQAAMFGDVVLHFHTTGALQGQEVPANQAWEHIPAAAYPGNHFLHIDEDPNQYKFHNAGEILVLVHAYNNAAHQQIFP